MEADKILGTIAAIITIIVFFFGIDHFSGFFSAKKHSSTNLAKSENYNIRPDIRIDDESSFFNPFSGKKCITIKSSGKNIFCVGGHPNISLKNLTISPDNKKVIATSHAIDHYIHISNMSGDDYCYYQVFVPDYSSGDMVNIKNLKFINNNTLQLYISALDDYERREGLFIDNKRLSGDGLYQIKFGTNNEIVNINRVN